MKKMLVMLIFFIGNIYTRIENVVYLIVYTVLYTQYNIHEKLWSKKT